ALPFVFAFAQLDAHFGYVGMQVGQPVVVTTQLKTENASPFDQLMSFATPGVRLTTSPIWFPGLRQVAWRVVADAPGDYLLRLRIGEATYEKTLHVSQGVARRSVVKPGHRLLDEVRYPSEPPVTQPGPV